MQLRLLRSAEDLHPFSDATDHDAHDQHEEQPRDTGVELMIEELLLEHDQCRAGSTSGDLFF